MSDAYLKIPLLAKSEFWFIFKEIYFYNFKGY